MPVKINGTTSGSVTLAAPNTGSDVTLTLPTSGFGKVLQVVYASIPISTGFSVSATSTAATPLTATITPISAASTLLVQFNASTNLTSANFAATTSMTGYYQMRRGTTPGADRSFGFFSPGNTLAIYTGTIAGSYTYAAGSTAPSTFTLWAYRTAGIMNWFFEEASMQIMEIAP